jgi:3' terminal RNA ribose 2'-O-methyltransferase Hen1
MLLTITSTTKPATNLGFILHKHPDKVQDFPLPFGRANVFYPVAAGDRTTAALLVEIDPVALVKRRGRGLLLNDYVNDRPYVASSFMSVAIARVFGSALRGRLDDRPELVDKPMSLEARVAVVSSFEGEDGIRRLFEPLDYQVGTVGHRLSQHFSSWGDSPYYTVTLECRRPVKELLGHLYVLLPVLDGAKHYWVDEAEISKLLRAGEGWLAAHPERDVIIRRYLKGHRSLADQARDRLLSEDVGLTKEPTNEETDRGEEPTPLNRLRLDAVVRQLKRTGARRILDLGCGDGSLIETLLRDPAVTHVAGMDVSVSALRNAARRLRLDEMTHRQRARVSLFQGSLTYRDRRLNGFDAAVLIEVLEHLDPWRVETFERNLFGEARPGMVILTTPNAEYNVAYGRLAEGSFRHLDHRFELTRVDFEEWARGVGERYGYGVEFTGIGEELPGIGSTTQMGIFRAEENGGEP